MKNDSKAFLLSPIALAVLTILNPAYGQQASPPPAPPEAGTTPPATAPAAKPPQSKETVIVTGYRQSLESALNAKREETGIVDVIKAEDVSKFPDTNLAESLQRVPGVVIDRDAGEGRNITVRGLGLTSPACASTASRRSPPPAAPTARAATTARAASTSTCSLPSSSAPSS